MFITDTCISTIRTVLAENVPAKHFSSRDGPVNRNENMKEVYPAKIDGRKERQEETTISCRYTSDIASLLNFFPPRFCARVAIYVFFMSALFMYFVQVNSYLKSILAESYFQ